MSNLIESILIGELHDASDIFESKMEEIKAKKLFEAKRQVAAKMNEIFGGMTKDEIQKRKDMGYRKAADVLGEPKPLPLLVKLKKSKADDKKKKVSEETLDELSMNDVAYGVGYAGGKAIKAGFNAAKTVKVASRLVKHAFRKKAAQQKATQQTKDNSPFPKDMHRTQASSSEKSKVGVIQQNINTALGRKANYVKPEDEKGGGVGKAVRAGAIGAAKVAKAAFSLV